MLRGRGPQGKGRDEQLWGTPKTYTSLVSYYQKSKTKRPVDPTAQQTHTQRFTSPKRKSKWPVNMKRLISLVIKEMQTKTIVRFHYL